MPLSMVKQENSNVIKKVGGRSETKSFLKILVLLLAVL